MAGLSKTKDYSWKDSNLALFGSDTERAVKGAAAATEEAWKPVAKIDSPTLLVWRIKQMKLEPVDPKNIGKFFTGDSYIILKVDKVENELIYDVHFWIGKESTQDEYTVAAYKTVELDTFLDDKAVQHREVDDFESPEFKSYFKKITKMKGGYQSGFNHVKPEEFRHRLLVIHGQTISTVECIEVEMSKRVINSDDIFVLDHGSKVIQFNGQNSSIGEKSKAAQYVNELKSSRQGKCEVVVIDEHDKSETENFMNMLPDEPIKPKVKKEVGKKAISKLSDESGKLVTSLVCEDHLSKDALSECDPYFIDTGDRLFVYIGDQCSKTEKRNALGHAHAYLKKTNHPLAPITVVSGNRKSHELEKIWD